MPCIVLFACFSVSLLVRSNTFIFNAKLHAMESWLWLRLFQAVGNMNIDAQSLMLATVAKSLVSLGYEVEVSFHATIFSTDCKMSSSLVGMPLGCDIVPLGLSNLFGTCSPLVVILDFSMLRIPHTPCHSWCCYGLGFSVYRWESSWYLGKYLPCKYCERWDFEICRLVKVSC